MYITLLQWINQNISGFFTSIRQMYISCFIYLCKVRLTRTDLARANDAEVIRLKKKSLLYHNRTFLDEILKNNSIW